MRIYFDTSAWSALHDAHVSRRRLEDIEILFSSCNLDEIGLANVYRAQDLAKFAWAVSNRKKILDHLELTSKELRSYREGTTLTEIYVQDPTFFLGWAELRKLGTPMELREQMQVMDDAKRAFREWLRIVRARFSPLFDRHRDKDPLESWPQVLAELENEGYIGQMLEESLQAAGLPAYSAQDVPYRALPATACWVQYYLCLAFLATHSSGKLARPDLGDQVDFRHGCYAGLADVFVSDDRRMRRILNEMIPNRRSTIQSPGEFIDTLGQT